MLESSASSLFILLLAALMSVFMASSTRPYPQTESNTYQIMPPGFYDYGAPEDNYEVTRVLEVGAERPLDPLEQRRRDLKKVRDAALRIEAEVREICENMEAVP